MLNGLGATKYEELFIVWRSVSRLLGERGLRVVEPEVGELVTSLDMAGCSLTLMWLDEELERFWRAPADTPAYRKGALGAAIFVAALEEMAAAVAVAATRLGEIEAVAGDGAGRGPRSGGGGAGTGSAAVRGQHFPHLAPLRVAFPRLRMALLPYQVWGNGLA